MWALSLNIHQAHQAELADSSAGHTRAWASGHGGRHQGCKAEMSVSLQVPDRSFLSASIPPERRAVRSDQRPQLVVAGSRRFDLSAGTVRQQGQPQMIDFETDDSSNPRQGTGQLLYLN